MSESSAAKAEQTPESAVSGGKKDDVESLRKIIKINPEKSGNDTDEDNKSQDTKTEKKPLEPQKSAEQNKKTSDTTSSSSKSGETSREEAGSPKDELGQKRQILQTMKDFDFQIKKNHEDITAVKDRIEGLSKDLDDLVSLYEIVSEQMNPFVGLSKVTKKRLDALENFTREVEELKNRMGEIESVIEVNKGMLEDIEKQIIEHGRIIPSQIQASPSTTEQKEKPLEPVSEDSSELLPTQPQIGADGSEPLTVQTVADAVPTAQETSASAPSSFAVNAVDWDHIINTSLESLLFDLKIEQMLDEFVSTLTSEEKK